MKGGDNGVEENETCSTIPTLTEFKAVEWVKKGGEKRTLFESLSSESKDTLIVEKTRYAALCGENVRIISMLFGEDTGKTLNVVHQTEDLAKEASSERPRFQHGSKTWGANRRENRGGRPFFKKFSPKFQQNRR